MLRKTLFNLYLIADRDPRRGRAGRDRGDDVVEAVPAARPRPCVRREIGLESVG
jgi:hypothetical protein